MTIELSAERNARGLAYRKALQSLKATWIALRAADLAAAHAAREKVICEGVTMHRDGPPVATFASPLAANAECLRHPDFASDQLHLTGWEHEAQAEARALQALAN